MFASFSRFFLLALFAVPALTAGTPSPVPVPPTRVRRALPDSALNPADIAVRALAANPADARPLTNGERLARGLPPRSPRLNSHGRRRALAARQSATPCALTQATGTIRVAGTDGNARGFVARTPNAFGEYSLTQDESAALSVVLLRCDSNSVPFDIQAVNGIADYPYLGAVVGYASTDDNITPSSTNYVYIAGTSQVAHGPAVSGPNAFTAATGTAKDFESAIWTLGDNNALVPQWTNTDGSVAAAQLVYTDSAQAFTLTGDVATFTANFGPTSEVAFTFVETA
ncbi:hypothetical protein BD413DRAFT_310319 [Trametes elegans]|nr:hypothetical protein BD413DRAFT_310319 [Trametes elegans]